MPNPNQAPNAPQTMSPTPNAGKKPSLLVSRLRRPPADPKTKEAYRSELLGEAFTPPTRSHPTDAGLDLTSSTHVTIGPFLSARLCHNLAVVIPDGHFGLILPRSSTLQEKGILVISGVIDPGFRGEVQTVVFNPSARAVQVQSGERLSQLVILPLRVHDVEVVGELPPAEGDSRGVSGFGSTGGFATAKQ